MSSPPSFYKKIAPLNRERHRKLKLRTEGRLKFASRTHFVPLTAVEFYDVARNYPIVFAGGEDAIPLAVVGLRSEENLFVGADGQWEEGAYVPAFIRRYPFILARADEKSDYTVCLDESFEGLSETDGEPLFDEEGKETQLLSETVELLKGFVTETERTRVFVERLRSLELLTYQSLNVRDRFDRTYALREFRVVDEKKLAGLEDGVVGELHRAGYLACIHAHLLSLGNVVRLGLRLPEEPPVGADAGGTSANPPS